MKILLLDQLDDSHLLGVARNFGFKLPKTALLICEDKDKSFLDEQELRAFYTSFTSDTQPDYNISLAKNYNIFPINLFCEEFEKYNIRSFKDFFATLKLIVKKGKEIIVQRTIFAEKSGLVEFKDGEIKIKVRKGMYVKDGGFEEYFFDKENQNIFVKKTHLQTTMLVKDDYTLDLTYISIPKDQQLQQKLSDQDIILLKQFVLQLQQLNSQTKLNNFVAQFVINNSSVFLVNLVAISHVEQKAQNLQTPFTQVLFLSDINYDQSYYIYFNGNEIDNSKYVVVKKENMYAFLSMIDTYFLNNLDVLIDCKGYDIYQIEELVNVFQNKNISVGFLVRESDSLSLEDLLSLHPRQLLLRINRLSEGLMRELETIIFYCNKYQTKCVFLLSKDVSEDLIMHLILLEKPLCFEITNKKDVELIYNKVRNCEHRILFKAAIKILKKQF